jgi:ABC-2 type transport system ATP-binding protein
MGLAGLHPEYPGRARHRAGRSERRRQDDVAVDGGGLLRPDGGSSRIFGVEVWADPVAAKQLVGVLPDGLALPERLTGRELLTYLGLLRGLDRATVAGRASELLEVLDEPFEAIDPVSAATIRTILRRFVDAGGSVVLSSHVMALVEQLCDRVGVMARGRVVAAGTLDQVRGEGSLDDAFVRLVGARVKAAEGLSWLGS